MKNFFLPFFLVLLVIRDSGGSMSGLPYSAFEEANIIARIQIDDDQEIIPAFKQERTASGGLTFSPISEKPDVFRHLATASIVDILKGEVPGEGLKIRHTNGYGCPNVIYQRDREYLVFLQKEADSGYYVTMGLYTGQFQVEDGQVLGFYLMPGYKHSENGRLPYERVTEFIKGILAQLKRPTAGSMAE